MLLSESPLDCFPRPAGCSLEGGFGKNYSRCPSLGARDKVLFLSPLVFDRSTVCASILLCFKAESIILKMRPLVSILERFGGPCWM